MNKQTIDIICVGEALIDLIGTQTETVLDETKDFHRYLGGSPTNVAVNIARLGGRSALVAGVGEDALGKYIVRRLDEAGVGIDRVATRPDFPSTIILVNRTSGTPQFIAYRGADAQLDPEQFSGGLLEQTRLFHTTCFALSKQPARDTILQAAAAAAEAGVQLSIDLNYSKQIWPETEQAVQAVQEYCGHGPFVKISQDDSDRLFGPGLDHDQIFDQIHRLGAAKVCLTLGKDGAKLSNIDGSRLELPALPLEKVMDATGAGDAFWSGFLFAHLQNQNDKKCMDTGLKMAAIKLQHVGRIPDYASALPEILNN